MDLFLFYPYFRYTVKELTVRFPVFVTLLPVELTFYTVFVLYVPIFHGRIRERR